jgi:hypothetical protein
LIDDSFQGKALSLDGEGVAYTQADFYVIGSHGHPRDRQHKLDPQRDAAEIAAKIAASSKIVRITETPGGPHVEVSTKLHAFIAADPILAPFADHRLDENGVTVEGIAIKGDRLFASFRQPSIHGNETPILSVKIDALFGSGAPDLRLDLLPIGVGLGVRDLAAFRDGLRILAGPAADAEGEYSVSWWSGQGRELKRLLTLPPILEEGAPVHPEAILPIAQQGQKLRVVVLSDGAKEGGPRVFDIDAP